MIQYKHLINKTLDIFNFYLFLLINYSSIISYLVGIFFNVGLIEDVSNNIANFSSAAAIFLLLALILE